MQLASHPLLDLADSVSLDELSFDRERSIERPEFLEHAMRCLAMLHRIGWHNSFAVDHHTVRSNVQAP